MKIMRYVLILLNILLVAIMSTSPVTAEELAPHLHKATLDNGLTVIGQGDARNKGGNGPDLG